MWSEKLQSLLDSVVGFWPKMSRRDKVGWLLVIAGLACLIFSGLQVVYAVGPVTPIAVDGPVVNSEIVTEQSFELKPDKEATITVDVSGAVAKPGIYELPATARVSQALISAGGLSKRANSQYVARQLNLAAKLTDGQKLYLPFAGETVVLDQSMANTDNSIDSDQSTGSRLINLNTSSLEELDTLPGIGQKRAQDILAGRPYVSLQQLIDRGILTASLVEKIAEFVTLAD